MRAGRGRIAVPHHALRSLSSELAALAERRAQHPRVYADANVPAGIVDFMRTRLKWDVFFVMEHDELRRAADDEHFRRARDMRRTLVSLDHDYLDDRRGCSLLRRMWAWTPEGGRLVVGNFHPRNPSRAYMEWCGDWHLIHRSEGDMLRLAAGAGVPLGRCRLDSETLGVCVFLVAQR